MKTPVQGLHHLTVMASDPQRNIDFYTQVLGQRLVKVTVNFDDPGTYHLYYGDEVGSPGTIMTFFPWPDAQRGERGNGEVSALAYAVPPHALGQWKARLSALNLDYTEGMRFGAAYLRVVDPDGLPLELIADPSNAPVPRPWRQSPLDEAIAPRGFHSVTLWVERAAPVATLLTEHLGFTRVGQENDPQGPRTRFKGDSDGVGLYIDVVERPGQGRGQFGAGSVHHVALRTRDDAEQIEYQRDLTKKGYGVTPVQDRQYFHSIYFRDVSGVLFEIATDAPGFPADEDVAELGRALKLPAWLESRRSAIEGHLAPIVNPEHGTTIGRNSARRGSNSPTSSAGRVNGPHQGQPLLTAGRTPQQARAAVLLVHGRGGSAQDILGLSQAFGMSAFAYLAPQAQGNTWYPQSFLAPMPHNEPDLSSGLQAIEDTLSTLEQAGIAREHVMLGGFSQGACLVSEFVARNAHRYGGVFAFSGGVIGPDGTPRDYPGSLDGTPVFLGCSDRDPHIPLQRVEESAEVFERLGGQVDKRIYPGMGHLINEDEIAAVQAMLQVLSVESL
ncbi:VOC family protein [Deinococcus peraridilitoris]|uniref:Putative esterase n=1 Tax=Deinococcus peraridilitoris (strain DSM 19664 / LMG 22246 / CIP 109416 / KR-200) TaxID=937777 RepID=K9ZVU3_DEIPD|nr:VOC family protein [Deinococcus peraridilitoris]AFZ65743.1 putative esterase [Deinococcus peraridilitoris DSM 19664]